MTLRSLHRMRSMGSRGLDLAPQLIRNPRLLYGGLRGINIGLLGALDRPWIRRFGIETVIDVGANTGQFSSAVHIVCPTAKIYAFEPLPDCVERLQERMKSVPRFQAFATAVGNDSGTVRMHRSNFSPSSSLLEMTSVHKEAFPWTAETSETDVKISTLDSFLPVLDLTEKVLLKIDVQGFEREVLLGAVQILQKAALVFVETSFGHLYEGASAFSDIYESMVSSGFEFRGFLDQLEHPNTGQPLQGDAIYVRNTR